MNVHLWDFASEIGARRRSNAGIELNAATRPIVMKEGPRLLFRTNDEDPRSSGNELLSGASGYCSTGSFERRTKSTLRSRFTLTV
jgi:hypothetical protein